MTTIRQANLLLKFVLELAALAAFGLWGWSIAGGALGLLAAIGAPAVAASIWGTLAAPRSRHRLPVTSRAPFELGVFALAALALYRTESIIWASALAAAALLNALVLTAFDQWHA